MTRAATLLVLALAVAVPSQAAPPQWLRAAVAAPHRNVPGATVVLLDDVDVTVTADGRLRTVRRYAIRLNDREGRTAARIREVYIAGSGRVTDLHGWLIRASGGTRDLDGDRALDAAIVDNDVYNEVRIRVLDASTEIQPGDVFGAEMESEERLLFAQVEWPLQERWPVSLVRRRLTLPAGWTARSVTFNAPAIEPRHEGNALVWEARELAGIPEEEGMPPVSDLAPRLGVSFGAAAGQRASGQFSTWADVASWLHSLSDATGTAPERVAAKAQELIAAARSERDRIAAIARYVQSVQYVSIQTGLDRGGGYQPRPPALVLERNYGDCKDKASLMRALLGAAGIKSYLVSIYAGDRRYVRPDWPTPQQFNHAIIAIAITERGEDASTIENAALGRLLLFDPTDEHTPLGELPLHEQGSYALIVHPSSGSLVQVPSASEVHHKTTRTIDGVVGADGSLRARVLERSTGDSAARRRALVKALDQAALRNAVERRWASAIQGASIGRVDVEQTTPEFVVRIDIAAERYAQRMGQLLLVRAPFDAIDGVPRAAAMRKTAVDLPAIALDEIVHLDLPAGFVVDEVSPDVTLETAFGRYTLAVSATAHRLSLRRTLTLRAGLVRVDEYGALRAFLDKTRAADTTPTVLVRVR
jgi:hypothetical protein